jgi:hypothetical protein
MNGASLSPALYLKEIQRIPTRLAPFLTIRFSSTGSEETLFRSVPTMEIMAPGHIHPGPFTMTLLCLQQLTTKGFDPRTFPPSSIGKLISSIY